MITASVKARLLVGVMAAAVWLASSAAVAQPASGPVAKAALSATVSPLTVQSAPVAGLIKKQTYSFVQSYAGTPNPNIDQISRWRDPVCVVVWGLPLADQAAKIKARIETMAQTLSLPAAPAGCKPNVEVAFTDDPQASMDSVAKRLEPLLGYYHRSRTDQLKTVTHSIQAWYVTGTTSDINTGALVASKIPPALYMNEGPVDDPQKLSPAGCFSRFTACYRSAFYNVLIVADSRALEGGSLSLVTDDMIMLALSQPKSLDGCNALPSVIDRFARSPCLGRDPPGGLTPADTAYLAALYSADTESRKRFEQRDIADRMAATLIKANAGAADGAGAAASAAAPSDGRRPPCLPDAAKCP
jgi:hypothetical protein